MTLALPRGVGSRTVLLYLTIYYFAPLAVSAVWGPHEIFNSTTPYPVLLITVLVWCLFIVWFARRGVKLPEFGFSWLPNVFVYEWLLLLLALLYLPVAAAFFVDYGISFRYSGTHLSEAGPIALIVSFYRGVLFAVALYNLALIVSGRTRTLTMRLICAVNGIAWLLTFTGAFEAATCLLMLVMSLKQGVGNRLVTARNSGLFSLAQLVRPFLYVAIVFAVLYVGFANKGGHELAVYYLSDALREPVLWKYLYYRISTNLSSLDVVLGLTLSWDFHLEAMKVLWDSNAYRVSLLFDPMERPDVVSLNRLNYLLLFANPSLQDTGTSPGPLAAFLYFPFFPFNALIAAWFVAAFANSFDASFRVPEGRRVTLVGLVIPFYVTLLLLHSPVTAYTLIGPVLWTALLITYTVAQLRKQAGTALEAGPVWHRFTPKDPTTPASPPPPLS